MGKRAKFQEEGDLVFQVQVDGMGPDSVEFLVHAPTERHLAAFFSEGTVLHGCEVYYRHIEHPTEAEREAATATVKLLNGNDRELAQRQIAAKRAIGSACATGSQEETLCMKTWRAVAIISICLNVLAAAVAAWMLFPPYTYREVAIGSGHYTLRTDSRTGAESIFAGVRGWVPVAGSPVPPSDLPTMP